MRDLSSSYSRRTVVAGLTTMLAGCSAFSQGGATSDSTPTPNAAGTSDDASITARSESGVVDSVPTCADTDADQLVSVTPGGFTVVAAARERATRIRERLATAEDAELRIDRAGIRLVELSGSDRIAVEIGDGYTELGELERFRGEQGILAVRRGRSMPTVRELAATARSQLEATEAVRPDRIEIKYVRPSPPDPIRFAVLLWGVGDTSVLERSSTFEIRVATGDSERTLATGTGIADASVADQPDAPAVAVSIAEGARSRFRRGLVNADALSAPEAHPLRVYSRGERIYEATLADSLVANLRRGTWSATGRFLVRFESPDEARQVARALGVLWFSIAANSRVEVC